MNTLEKQIEINERTIKFLENHIIECGYHEGCGRCDEARDITAELIALQEQLKAQEGKEVKDENTNL